MYDLMTSINLTSNLHFSISIMRLCISKQFLERMINDYFLNVEH